MTYRCVTFRTRVATKNDVSDSNGKPLFGVNYFCLRSDGTFDSKMYVLDENTDIDEFKTLYAYGQIYVLATEKQNVLPFNCIDWHLVDKELDYELEQLDKLNKKSA
ncbi:hypothetical protein [Flavobacterium sp.]|uniref:hypothetical protein n=1 Tax=Flavobacterium sp. TaxID=239 RepID=UPI004048903F